MKVEFVLVTQRPGRLGRLSLAGQLLVVRLVILLGVLVTGAVVSLAQSESTFTRTEGRRLSAIAEDVAATPIVRTEMSPGGVLNVLPAVVQSVVAQYDVGSLTIADADEV